MVPYRVKRIYWMLNKLHESYKYSEQKALAFLAKVGHTAGFRPAHVDTITSIY